jgi:hypothetical protein
MLHKSPTVHALVFTMDGTLQRELTIPVLVEDTMIFAEIALTVNSMAVDNEGNVYLIEFHQPGVLEALKFSPESTSPTDRLATSIDNASLEQLEKLGEAHVAFDKGLMRLTIPRLSWSSEAQGWAISIGYDNANDIAPVYGAPSGLTQVTMDFPAHRAYSFDAGNGRTFIASLYDRPTHRTVIASESRVNYTTVSHSVPLGDPTALPSSMNSPWMNTWTYSHTENFCYGMYVACYDDTGKEQWSTMLTTVSSPAHPYYAGSIRDGKFNAMYDSG